MNDVERWYAGNNRYLSLSLAWLRLRLERAAAAPPAPTPPTPVMGSTDFTGAAGAEPARPERTEHPSAAPPTSPPPEREPAGRPRRRGEPRPPRVAAPAGEGKATARDVDVEIAAAADAVAEAAAAISPPPALERLAGLLGLSAFERQVLLLCVARSLDPGLGQLCVAAHGSPWPTFALALRLFDDPAWDVVSPHRPLRWWRLVEITPVAGGVLTGSALNADERIANAVKGLDHLDERLAPLVEVVPQPASPLPPSQRAVVTAAVDLLRRSAPGERPPLIQLVGPHRHARAAVAASIAAEVDCELLRLPARLLPAGPAEIDLTARLWHREAILAPVALFLDEEDMDDTPGGRHALASFLSRSGGLLLLGGRDVTDELPGPTVALDVAGPTAAEQRAAWEEAVGPDGGVDVAPLVAQFDLEVDTIRSVVRYAGPLPDGPRGTRVLWAEARRQLRPRLESAAQRVEPVATWESLVLPEPELAVLHQIAGQVAQRSRVYTDWGFGARMNRGLGITALFAGESGTGKSMAAEVLANDCDLDLYRIDLSSVVSKYIGETEKNLRRLFDAAEGGGVILFFDEADALFGKRSEVKDAHDRYANIEVNFLLQRMEVYRGLAILATNMRGALDRAFTRRLRFIVTFPFPRPADRARMWQIAFPAHVPLDPLDISRLSRIDLTGAGVATAALNAAFLAAAAGQSVGMAEVLTAVRNELRKLERPINEADFRLEGQVRV